MGVCMSMKRLLLAFVLLSTACDEETEQPATSSTTNVSSSTSGGGGQGGANTGGGGSDPGCDPTDIAPKLHYRFEGDATNAGELGSEHDGIAELVTYVPGKIGQAVKFDGPVCEMAAPPPSHVDLPGTAALLQTYPELTIGLWYRLPAMTTKTDCVPYLLKCRGQGSGFETYYGPAALPGELTTCFTESDNMTSSCRSHQGTVDEWHHLLYRYDGNALEIYLDNELVLTMDTALSIFGSVLDNLDVGRFSFFDVDELKLYDQVFDPEIQCTEVIGGCWRNGSCVMP
jgi:hypothetical protein